MLVLITGKKNEEILTANSRLVAECFEKRHDHVLRDIENLRGGLPNFGEMFMKGEYIHPQNGQAYPEYEMTRDGFSLLAMGFTGEKALQWKLKYIEAFNEMERELRRLYDERKQWEIERAKGVVIRHILTDTIKMRIEDSPHKRFAYPNYTKLIYMTLFGKTVKDLQSDLGVKPKESIRDYLAAEQLKDVESMEMLVSSLLNCGWGYAEIKQFVESNATKKITA